jgi:hypothetical protein
VTRGTPAGITPRGKVPRARDGMDVAAPRATLRDVVRGMTTKAKADPSRFGARDDNSGMHAGLCMEEPADAKAERTKSKPAPLKSEGCGTPRCSRRGRSKTRRVRHPAKALYKCRAKDRCKSYTRYVKTLVPGKTAPAKTGWGQALLPRHTAANPPLERKGAAAAKP